MAPSQSCENCGRSMGSLETNYIFKSRVVCQKCHGALMAGALPSWQVAAAPVPVVVTRVGVPVVAQPSRGRGLVIAGAVLMAVSLPLLCLGGIGLLPLVVGLVLLIVGLCI